MKWAWKHKFLEIKLNFYPAKIPPNKPSQFNFGSASFFNNKNIQSVDFSFLYNKHKPWTDETTFTQDDAPKPNKTHKYKSNMEQAMNGNVRKVVSKRILSLEYYFTRHQQYLFCE